MLAWSEGTDNGRQKTEIMDCDVIVGELLQLLRSPSQLCPLNPKTQINRRRTLPASFPLVGCLPQAAWPERLLSAKSGRCGMQQIKERGALPMIDHVVISVATSTVAAISGFTAGRWLWSVRTRADSLIAKFKEAGGTVREIDV